MIKAALKNYITIFCLILNMLFCAQIAQAEIGVLKPDTCPSIFNFKHKDKYQNQYKNLYEKLKQSELEYSVLKDSEFKKNKEKYEVIMLPYVHDYPKQLFNNIEKYVKQGGKLIIVTSNENYHLDKINALTSFVGVKVLKIEKSRFDKNINWVAKEDIQDFSLNKNANRAILKLDNDTSTLAFIGMQEENLPAVTLNKNGSFISWQWGIDGSNNFDIRALQLIMKKLDPESTIKIEEKLAKENYLKEKKLIIEYINLSRNSLTKSIGLNEKNINDLKSKLDLTYIKQNKAQNYFDDKNYIKALDEIRTAKNEALSIYFKTLKSSNVEARALWIDRGTIVKISSQKEMAGLFRKIKAAGINLVYLETVNAGYSIYPSQIAEQNPLTKGKNPLKWAVKEAHKRDIELHAWIWAFAVGNKRHNPLINKNKKYEGPVISKNPQWGLLGIDGNLRPRNQYEYWLDPSNEEAKDYLKSLIKEISFKYNIDGIQLDYIRYPFQSKYNLMGLNLSSRQLFEKETGCILDNLTNEKLKVFNNWKREKINDFVQEINEEIKSKKSDCTISAAVFGGSNDSRFNTIQQDWQLWSEKGWIDVLNPMIYSKTAANLKYNISLFNEKLNGKVFVYPGIAIKHLDDFSVLNQINMVSNMGLNGNTLFAMAYLDDDKIKNLSNGPYRYKNSYNPVHNPLKAIRIILKEVLADIKTQKTQSNKRQMAVLSTQLKNVYKFSNSTNLRSLSLAVKNLDKAQNRLNQGNYHEIKSVIQPKLKQIKNLLYFVEHREKIKND